MIEPPRDLAVEAIVDRVRNRFDISVQRATFLPLGNDASAWSFSLDGGGARWFLKVFRRVDAAAIELPRFLAARDVEHVVPPLLTRDGVAFDSGDPYTFVLFPFVDAVPAGQVGLAPAQREELGRFLRRLHDTEPDEALTRLLREERFEVRDEAYIERAGETLDDEPSDSIAADLIDRWRAQRGEIAYALQRAHALARYGVQTAPPLVPCHADFHAWNVLIEPSGDMRRRLGLGAARASVARPDVRLWRHG
jgi:spectinomycin phosphotransferase